MVVILCFFFLEKELFVIWLNPLAGEKKRILCSDWLPEQARWAWDIPPWFRKKKLSFWPYNKFFIDEACSVKITVCLKLASFFCTFLLTETKRRKKTEELGQ